ncbi:uncharacterized protein LOC120326026 [Styela clava]
MAEADSSESSTTNMKPETEWSTREKLAIASYVLRTGEQHWSGVGRLLKPLGEPDRPPDWFSPKFCAQQYTALVDQTDAPKRKRGSERSDSSENIQPGSSPEDVIVSRLTKVRIEELKKQLRYERTEYRKLKREIELIESGTVDDRLDELINEIENEGREMEYTMDKDVDTQENNEIEDANSLAEEIRNEIEKLQRTVLPDEDTIPKLPGDIVKDNEPAINVITDISLKTEESKIIGAATVVGDTSLAEMQNLDNVPQENKVETKEKSDFDYTVTESFEKDANVAKNVDSIFKPIPDEIESQKEDIVAKNEKIEQNITVEKQEKNSENLIETEARRKHSSTDDTVSSEVAGVNNSAFNFSIDETLHQSISLPGTPAPPDSFVSDSFPSSPALSHSSDMDPDSTASWKAWRKSIMILWKQVASHRYASLFLQPVTDDIAPNYSTTVYRSMDLSQLKKNIENGVTRTTTEFHRDLMLMFQNAIMYNSREHDVFMMTTEMQKDVMDQVAQFMSTQMMAETTQPAANKSLRRSTMRRSAFSEKTNETRSRRSGAADTDTRPSRS